MKIALRTIKWYLHFVLTLLLMYPKIIKYEKIRHKYDKDQYDKEVFDITKKWALKQLKVAGVEVIATGLENLPQENVLFISNHQGNFDIPVLMSNVNKPKGFIAKKSIERFPVVNRYMYIMNSIFIDRDNMKDAARVIIEGIKILNNGHSLIIFPEGTRSKSSNMGEFKNGAIKLATKSKVKIVPISINGTYHIMEENNNKIKPGKVQLHIHEAIDTASLTADETKDLLDKVKVIIENKVKEFESLS